MIEGTHTRKFRKGNPIAEDVNDIVGFVESTPIPETPPEQAPPRETPITTTLDRSQFEYMTPASTCSPPRSLTLTSFTPPRSPKTFSARPFSLIPPPKHVAPAPSTIIQTPETTYATPPLTDCISAAVDYDEERPEVILQFDKRRVLTEYLAKFTDANSEADKKNKTREVERWNSEGMKLFVIQTNRDWWT